MSHTRMTSLPLLLLALSLFIIFDSHRALISCPLCKSNTLSYILMILGRNVEQDERRVAYKNDNSYFLTFGAISLCLFLKLIVCPLCNSNTLRNILMVFGRNVEQDATMCRIQE